MWKKLVILWFDWTHQFSVTEAQVLDSRQTRPYFFGVSGTKLLNVRNPKRPYHWWVCFCDEGRTLLCLLATVVSDEILSERFFKILFPATSSALATSISNFVFLKVYFMLAGLMLFFKGDFCCEACLFESGILDSTRKIRDNPYLNITTVLFDDKTLKIWWVYLIGSECIQNDSTVLYIRKWIPASLLRWSTSITFNLLPFTVLVEAACKTSTK